VGTKLGGSANTSPSPPASSGRPPSPRSEPLEEPPEPELPPDELAPDELAPDELLPDGPVLDTLEPPDELPKPVSPLLLAQAAIARIDTAVPAIM
jgi:hypothetical protein